MILAVMSDVGGVLLHIDWPAVAAHWEAALGLPRDTFLRGLFGGSDDTVLVGRVSEEDWWDQVCVRLGADRSLRARLEAFLEAHEQVDPEMARFLASLRPTYGVALVSNAWPRACERMRAHWRLGGLYDALVFSCEAGVAKPDRDIYLLACQQLGVEPYETVFIDDSVENTDAAARLGMKTVLFKERDRAIEDVRRLLDDTY